MHPHKIKEFPASRISTIDIFGFGQRKHHVAAMIELDVSDSRDKIKKSRKKLGNISFTAWLIKVIAITIKDHETAAAFLKGKRKAVIFNDVNVSLLVEKTINGHKVPMPMVIEKTQERSIESITQLISDANAIALTEKDIVLQKKPHRLEGLYYSLPGFLRRMVWRYILYNPHVAFNTMGNVAVTSIGMMGNVKGWFIPASVHPLCFGISAITQKPVVVNNEIAIREVLNLTILLDHDVIDGGSMARFIRDLARNVEGGAGL
jgi:pyruvate/2-oxoglutarate dehydrogenase complex dihydrolipoamide acyltransferase (E2) component